MSYFRNEAFLGLLLALLAIFAGSGVMAALFSLVQVFDVFKWPPA